MHTSWIHPALYRKEIPENRTGLFSSKYIPAGTTVAVIAGGKIINSEEAERLWHEGKGRTRQIHDQFHWAPLNQGDLSQPNPMNHSCDPNVRMAGDMCWETSRGILPHNDELTVEYATFESRPYYHLKCLCGSEKCRKVITGNDWMKLALQIRYYGRFAPYLQREVESILDENNLAVRDEKLYFIDRSKPKELRWHEIIGGADGLLANEEEEFRLIQTFRTAKLGPMLALDRRPRISAGDGRIYAEILAAPSLLLHPDPQRIYILGGGNGALLSFLLGDMRIKEIVAVENSPMVVELRQKYMPHFWKGVEKALESGRAKIVYGDALHFLREEKTKADIIYYDLPDLTDILDHVRLLGGESFAEAKNLLKEDGLLAVQSGPLLHAVHAYYSSVRNCIGYGFSHVLSYAEYLETFGTKWSFALASNKKLPDLSDQGTAEILFAKRKNFLPELRWVTPKRLASLFVSSEVFRERQQDSPRNNEIYL